MADSFSRTASPFSGGDALWASGSNASKVAQNEFFFDPTGYIKYWDGSKWVLGPIKYWDGTKWVQKPLRFWDGSFWLLTEYGLGTNLHPSSLDIFAWSGTGANNATLSRDTVTGKSPSNGDPLKMAVTGGDPHMQSYNGATWNIAPADNGQTWLVKVWAKASVATTGQIFIFGVDRAGAFIDNGGNSFNAGGFNIGTTWSEVSYSFKFNDERVSYIQTRLDGPDGGGTIDVWWDDLRVYRII